MSSNSREVNLFHNRSDVDSSKHAQHHTLGARPNQAASGDHRHVYNEGELFKLKLAYQDIVSSIVPVNDNDLFFPVEKGYIYAFEMHLIGLCADGAGDLRMRFNAPSGAVFHCTTAGLNTTNAFDAGPDVNFPVKRQITTFPTTDMIFQAGSYTSCHIYGVLNMQGANAVAGTLNFQWAQSVSTGSNTFIMDGSWLHVRRHLTNG